MPDITRRGLIGLGAGAAAAAALAGCGTSDGQGGTTSVPPGDRPGGGAGKPDKPAVRPIGDGSTSYTGKQPNQPGRPVPSNPASSRRSS